jgi:putative oxidoreductase
MRLAVGGVFLIHGIAKFERGIGATAHMLANVGFPFSTIFAVMLMTIETVGAICILLGILTRAWAGAMAVVMVVAILAVKVRNGMNFELEALLLAGAVTLVALGDGPLSIAVRFKRPPM